MLIDFNSIGLFLSSRCAKFHKASGEIRMRLHALGRKNGVRSSLHALDGRKVSA